MASGSWVDYITYVPPVKRVLDTGDAIWSAITGPAGQAVANESYKVLRSFGLIPFSLGLIFLSSINKSLKDMDAFHRPPYNGPRTSWDPFNSMNYITGDISDWDVLTTAALLGDPETWDPVIWSNGGEGFSAAWNPIEVLA